MAGDRPGDFQDAVTKRRTAALGFRVKSHWATVVLLTRTPRSTQVLDIDRIELCDPRFPETRKPYRAGIGELEMDTIKLNQ
jgi:hypothetical protein